MAFLVRNTHRTFSAIFTKTLANPSAQLPQWNLLKSPARAVGSTPATIKLLNPKLTATDEVDLNAQPNVEVLKNPPEWKYVERLLAAPTIPLPTPKIEYSSGWEPQKAEALKQSYFIRRSRNHMIPVYLKIGFRGLRKQTVVRNIKGDIWKLNNELMDYIEYYMAKKERSNVNEFTQQIRINGDYVNLIKDYLASKGF